jgi:hypothetical protein
LIITIALKYVEVVEKLWFLGAKLSNSPLKSHILWGKVLLWRATATAQKIIIKPIIAKKSSAIGIKLSPPVAYLAMSVKYVKGEI